MHAPQLDLTDLDETVPRRTLATFENYADAQALIDRLSDGGFAVDRLMIVGRDLRLVERVTGQLDAGRSALAGAAAGSAMGGLFGLLFGVAFTHDGVSLLAIVLYWLVSGAGFGGLFGLLASVLTGGRRDFMSETGLRADRYEVLVDESVAEEAERLLGASPRPARSA
ncbi:MAG: hypothetical protein QOG87_2191 [Actinomycetota bacterium]